ncbi:MAG: DUF349 domain-containing protein [Marinilabiliales bacterium]|nr:MAG: DUF349 domain-containing protein [Marinilabiliales bacterium]
MSSELENKQEGLAKEGNNSDVEAKIVENEVQNKETDVLDSNEKEVKESDINSAEVEKSEIANSDTEKENEEDIFTDITDEDSNEDEEEDFSELSKEEILEKLRLLIHESEIDKSRKSIETLKSQYYKLQKSEYDKIKKDLKEKAGDDVEFKMPKDPTEDYLKEPMVDYKKKKAEFATSQDKKKEDNLQKKLDIIEKIKGLANSEESLNKTFNEFKDLQQEWLEIGNVPASEATNLWKNYQLQIERFYYLVRINKELRDLDFKKNLEQKLELCEKAEELLLETDAVASYKNLQELHNLWKELGPVPADKREEIWDRFSLASKKIRQAYQEHFEKLKDERKANYEQKLVLCEKAEAIANAESPNNGKEWGEQTEKVLELQKIWKTIGMVPKEVNTEVYERFRAACNRFFNAKKEFFETINEELNGNYQRKLELCVSAESLQDSTDWKKSTEAFFDLQKRWKEIGPAPKKHSDQVWKRFRAACDKFFNAKSDFYSNIDKEHKENLIKKETLIKEIQEFKPGKEQAENINSIKEFQKRWTEIGYVANKHKDRLYTEYRSAVNYIYEKLNLNKNALDISNFNSKIEVLKETGEANGLKKERSRILKRIQDLNLEINQYENNMGFFSSGSDSILKDFEKKINKAKTEIKTLKEKKKSIDLAERELKKKDSNDEQND